MNELPKLRLQINQEYTKALLPITGEFPSWLRGRLVRNCTVPVYEEGKEITHYFDGIAMLHSFQIEEGKVQYSSRFIESETYAKIIQSDPEFYKQKVNPDKTKNIQDAGVSVFKYNNSFVALTESPLPVCFDINTLETLGNFKFQDELPKKDTFESAHPHFFNNTKEVFNFFIEYGRTSQYVLYKMIENSSTREVIARIPVQEPGYIHSFSMTENFLILVEFPFVIDRMRLFSSKVDSFASYIRLFNWNPTQGTRFLIVDKSTGKLVSELKSEAIFSFHHANAYENGKKIIIDLIAHNFSKLEQLFPQSKGSSETIQGLLRYRIALNQKKLSYEQIHEKQTEFPKFADHLNGKAYRYLYLLNLDSPHPSLLKYDLINRVEMEWHDKNTSVIEPIFISTPGATREDDGILLTVAHNHSINISFLLVLDAQNLTEIARAPLPEPLPKSFHGQFF